MKLSKIQKEIWQNKINKRFNTTDVNKEFCLLYSEVTENYYGIPKELEKEVKKYKPEYIKNLIEQLYLNLEFINFMKKQPQYTKEFEQYIIKKVKIIDKPIEEDWYGCFPILKNDVLVDVRLLIPIIKDIKTLLVNIHEYQHAMDLYNELGKTYFDKVEEKEDRAKKLEKKFSDYIEERQKYI